MSQKAFLRNSSYNEKPIDLLAVQLEAEHHTVVRWAGHANKIVFCTVLDHACTGGNADLIAADTELLIMLISFWNSLIGQITMKSEATKNHKVIERDIGSIAKCIRDVRKYFDVVSCLRWMQHDLSSQGFFNHLLRAVSTRSALFEKWSALFSIKNSKNTYCLGGCSVLNALIWKNQG